MVTLTNHEKKLLYLIMKNNQLRDEKNLCGAFPVKLTKLHGLMVLNLSIETKSVGKYQKYFKLTSVASFDLSSNKLSGVILSSMESMSFFEL